MQKSIERIAGDTEGVSYEFPVFRFEGSDKAAPSAYLQAALHAGELPGVVAIDALMPMLAKAEAEGRIKGSITIVPSANPIGRAQYHFGEHQGRFHLGTRTNFNRGFPLLAAPDTSLLPDTTHGTVDQQLKIAAAAAFHRPRHRARPALRRRGPRLSLRPHQPVAGNGRLRCRHGRRCGRAVERRHRRHVRGRLDHALSERPRRCGEASTVASPPRSSIAAYSTSMPPWPAPMPKGSIACWWRAA